MSSRVTYRLFRILSSLRVGTKAGLAGGSVYLYYKIGLWKSSDETIENYELFKKDLAALYEAAPTDLKKWSDYGFSTIKTNVDPYYKAVADFRNEWLNIDISWLTESGDGVIKPAWNRGVSWTVETLKDAPGNIKKLSKSGWEKMTELGSESSTNRSSSDSEKQ